MFVTVSSKNETLESYLLRLANANGFVKFSLFQNSIKELLSREVSKRRLVGALPSTLAKINLFKAKNSSIFRVRAIKLIEQFACLEQGSLLDISILRTNLWFGASRALSRNGVLFPKAVLRDDSFSIPVCPECLKQLPYIRFDWHLKTVSHCYLHKVELMHNCPQCGVELNYIKNELIDSCICGFKLSSVEKSKSSKDLLLESESMVDYGKYFWFSKYKDIAFEAPNFLLKLSYFFEEWPKNYLSKLDLFERTALKVQAQPFNKVAVNEIWKEQLSLAKYASPIRYKNFIIDVLTDYFIELVERYPISKHANLADSLLTLFEAALFLRTTTEQVFLLVEQGYLDLAVNLKSENYLEPYLPVFYLRQVVELIQAQGINSNGFNRMTTAW